MREVFAIGVDHRCSAGLGFDVVRLKMKLTLTSGFPPAALTTKDSISFDTNLKTPDRIPEDDAGGGLCWLEGMVLAQATKA